MRLLILFVALVTCVLIAPVTALAKGASAASIDGPGGPIDVGGDPGAGEPGSGADLDRLASSAGIYAVAFGDTDARMVSDRPDGDLGPRHTITWTVPQPDGSDATVVQELYPYAEAGALTHTAGGQMFFDGMPTRQAWYVGGADLTAVLTDVGLAAQAPAAPSPAPVAIVVVVAAAVALVAGALVARRVTARRRPADAIVGP